MEYSFQKHSLSVAEKLWIQEVVKTDNFDPKVAKVLLLDKLPEDFDPRTIDSRVYVNRRLTLIGLWLVNPRHPIFDQLNQVINAIRKRIVDRPGIEMITATDIAVDTELSKENVGHVLHELSQIGNWFSSSSGSSDRIESIQLSSENAYDEYLRYKGINELLEKFYVNRGPSKNEQWSAALLQGNIFDVSQTPGDVGQKSFKSNTAFILMAIDPDKPELVDVYNTIKRVSSDFGINALRADDIEHQDCITELILHEISTCEYLIADLSYERPNVYYEIGFAHAINKKPILYRKFGTRLHFDLSVHNVPEYRNITELEELLRRRLEAIFGRKVKAS